MLKPSTHCIILLLFFCGLMQAQEYISNIRSFGVADGLSHRNVKCVTEDRNGFIWIGLENGLQRFDGTEFKTWNAQNGYPEFSNIRNIVEDDQGWLWAWNSDTDKFIFIHQFTEEIQTQEQRFGKKFPTANGMFTEKNWAAFPIFKNDDDGTLYLYNGHTAQIISYHSSQGFKVQPPLKLQQPISPRNIKMVKYHNHRFWLVINGEKNQLIEIDSNGKVQRQSEIEGKNIHYFSSSDEEVVLLGESEQTLISINSNNLQAEYQKNTPVLKVWAARGYFWELDHSKITLRKSMRKDSPALYAFATREHQRALQNVVGSYEDRHGRFWLFGAYGLFRISLQQTAFKKYFYIAPESSPTYNNAARSIVVKRDTMYAAFEYQGIAKTPIGTSNGFGIVDGDFHIKQYFYAARGLIMNEGGTLITTGNGVLRWLKGKNKWEEKIEARNEKGKIIRSLPKETTEIWSLYTEKDEVWIGTSRGLWKRKADGNYVIYDVGVSNYNPIYFIHSKGKTLWLGSQEGLFSIDKETGKIEKLRIFEFKQLPVYCYIHFEGKDYFGTEDGLLIRDKSGKISQIKKTDGLSGEKVFGVYPDYNGNLWMSTDNGISYKDVSTGKITIFREEDGITHNEFNRVSHYKDEKGRIYFGGLNGITAIDPRLGLKHQGRNLVLQVTSFEIFSEEDDKPQNRIKNIRLKHEVKIYPDDRFLRLRFAIPGTDNPKELLYAWKIENIDDSWNYQKENVLQFASLPYGKQVLHLKGQTNTGKWTPTLTITIEVIPPFYLRPWFITLMICLTAFLILVAFKVRTKRLEKLQRELEKQIEIATEEIVRNKETIEQQVKELQKADEVKTRFFTNITHELRTPLSLIKGPLSSIVKSGKLDEKNLSFLQIAQKHAQVLQKLVTSLLDLSKLESGTMKIDESTFSLFERTRLIVSNFESYIQQAGIEFIFDYNAERSMFIKLDKEKLEIILNNLISNAAKFTPKGGTITVSVHDNKNEIIIKVRDTGVGIQPDELPHVFDRFYQASNTDEIQTGGTGIGLALSSELAKLMKGNISVESTPGKGSCFTLKIPRNEVLAGFTPVAEKDSGQKKTYTLHKTGARILIVEDNTSLSEYLTTIMSEYYQVECASDGKMAVEFLEQLDEKDLPDLIVSDVMMPGMDGYQLLEYLKSHEVFWRIPVIMLTARVALQDKLKALRIGVDDYITKPFEEEELLVRISNLLKYASNRQNEINESEGVEEHITTLPDQNWLADFEKYIGENFSDENFSINKTSHHFAMSESTLLKRVKLLTGLSPVEYLREYRLNKGKELLERGEKQTIAEVAFAVGFSNAKAFSQSFKVRFGKLPSDYVLKPRKI
jgi:signal transduction histidine kinase/DNA-binding response OmpR family regulator/ligand-binding sensor domain-containing protein